MADQTPAAAPAAAPAPAQAPAQTQQNPPNTPRPQNPPVVPPGNPGAQAGGTVRRAASPLITNPPADAAPAAPEEPKLPQSTIDEMEAGRRALERNRPAAAALEEARARAEADKTKA